MINLPITGLSNDNTNISYISNDRESDSTKYLHENDNNRKSYPQRNNRSKLNYRDLERGMYEEIRQSMWTVGGSTFMNNNNTHFRNDGEHEIIDLSMDDDDDDDQQKSMNDTDQMRRHLWCICQKPWDHSRVMLRCDSCANWYHGDCIGVSAEKAKTFEIDGDQFICPPCRGVSYSTMKRAKSFEDPIPIKQKRSDETSPIRRNNILPKSISHDESTKRSKANDLLQQNTLTESQTHCMIHGCTNWTKSGWLYCSSACIRRHINETLQTIQRSKETDDLYVPTSDDILLYESKSKTILGKSLVPKIEDLCTWINQHPSYQIMKSASRQSISLTGQQSKDLARPRPRPTKSQSSLTSVTSNQKTNIKSIPNKKSPIQLGKSTSKIKSNANNPADIRSRVPTALYDKIIMRLEKGGDQHLMKQDIRTRVNKIEEEMFRVYGKVDNSYKNKFRSLLANISNMNNNFFYKQILSKELTAKQIVAMKSEDMLPPEEKEKRKDEFNKEIQSIIISQEQIAVEMAQRMRTKRTRQGLVDNDTYYSLIPNSKEQNPSGKEIEQPKDNQPMEKNMEINSTTDESIAKIESKNQTESLPPTSSSKKIDSNESSKPPIVEETNPTIPVADLDNDYIEPESPTGIDALIYDEEDNDDDLNTASRSSATHSPVETTEDILPYQPIIRDDYNPSKAQNETASISPSASVVPLSNQWRGVIHPSDTKLPCQSVHIYGDSNYLINHIPEHLVILGRLRLGDLWDYIRDSLAVRDIVILTLISSPLHTNDNERFIKYVDTMHRSGRAAVISKCTNSSLIRDMYILPADTKECPLNVLSSLFLPMTFESKQLFLVIVGTGKRTIKSIDRSSENQLLNNLIYKPVGLQDSTITRDPRLLKNKDPRLHTSHKTSENVILPTQKLIDTKQMTMQYTNEDLLKLISDSLQRIRHSSTTDAIRSIITSTTEILKADNRDDLITSFNDNFRVVMTKWQTIHGNTSISIPTIAIGDNLTEENMDVDDDQDDKKKKQIITSMDPQMTKTSATTPHRKQRQRSRFSDVLPTDLNRVKKSKSNLRIEKVIPKAKEDKSSIRSTTVRINNTRIASPELIDNTQFQPMINSTEPFIPSINTKDNLTSNPSRFSFSQGSYRRDKLNTNDKDINESSSEVLTDSIQRVQTYDYQGSSNSNEWRSRSSNNYYMTHYHDFDRPEE